MGVGRVQRRRVASALARLRANSFEKGVERTLVIN